MPITPTIENLENYGAAPLARWLIGAAHERHTIKYGEAKKRFEKELDFTTVFSILMGKPAGHLMDLIFQYNPNAPLLNTLLVSQHDDLPSDGAGPYLAEYFNDQRLAENNAKKRYPNLWRRASDLAKQSVYAFKSWPEVYEEVFEQPYITDPQVVQRRAGTDGAERDGLPRGRVGEGENHRALRLWVKHNPAKVLPTLRNVRGETEVVLLSGDRVDVVYYAPGVTWALEVKSRDSNDADLMRGVYQCVKYHAVMLAMDTRDDAKVKAALVTEDNLPGYIAAIARHLGIRHIKVLQDREVA